MKYTMCESYYHTNKEPTSPRNNLDWNNISIYVIRLRIYWTELISATIAKELINIEEADTVSIQHIKEVSIVVGSEG